MPPKKAASAASAAATKKAPAKVTKTSAAASKKATAAKKAAAAKPAPSASRSRKTKDEYDVDESDDEPEPPKAKKTAAASAKKTSGVKAPAAAKKAAPAKKTAARKAAPAKKAAPAADDDKENANPSAPKANGKRKRDETEEAEVEPEESEEEAPAPPVKKAKTAAPKKIAVPKIKFPKVGAKINSAPTAPLHVFVMGEGSSGELGMGSKRLDGKMPIDVKRPRINPLLSSEDVGVVQIACGGMHVVALTKDNKILTWGVNDQGALGRDTAWGGGLRDVDAEEDESEDEDDDSGVNPRESTPTEVDTTNIAPDAKFVQVVASDSASFALTEDGRVYGWGTFRGSDGVIGFSQSVETQKVPVLLPEPKKIVQLAVGSNHVLALDHNGKIFTWGCPEQGQLGRRCIERNLKGSALRPDAIGFEDRTKPKRGVKIVRVGCGAYHSFAVDDKGRLFAWGLNNFGNLGIKDHSGMKNSCLFQASLVEALESYKIADITGGEHHSLACTDDGKLLAWGRCDGSQTGIEKSRLNEDNALYERGRPRALVTPLVVDGISDVVRVAAGTDSNLALTSAGKAYSWGFSINYQTGQGTTDDIETPTLIDNTAVRDRKLVYVGCGGQFSILACEAAPAVNGVGGASH